MTRVVLIGPGDDLAEYGDALKKASPDLEVLQEHEEGSTDAEVAVCWNPSSGSLGRLEKLKLVHSIAAGVDHIFADPSLPAVPVCRVVDPGLKQGMAEYVLWGALHFFRKMDTVLLQQRNKRWRAPVQRVANEWTVGVMGLGELGEYAAHSLKSLGFAVRGWSRSPKKIEGISTWAGQGELDIFLQGLDCLVCLIPLTQETRGILNKECFDKMSKGSVLINAARGGHLVIDDLIGALRSGSLRGALLDVFEEEPLSYNSELWNMSGVIITPHMASSASTAVITAQIIENIRRLDRGEALLNQVGREGY